MPTCYQLPHWVCAACGHVTSHSDIWAWDRDQRARLSEIEGKFLEAGPSEDIVNAYIELCDVALERCHPNHAVLLGARLRLVAQGVTRHPNDSATALRKLAWAEEALLVAERVLPSIDLHKVEWGCWQLR